ncbi:unnamed protein product [Euphydryas editha]|uniref:Uncharacterized protein n=1 Tax=Euphydryas editha TaxID=104508 RepID=A0AAU9VBQ6_EUPED|nr:unnamed protein product [Euphydryas editha]
MDNFEDDIDDLLNLTDTDTTSSSNPEIFEGNQKFVMDLHDIIRDESKPETVIPAGKIKKRKKKKTLPESDLRSGSSSSSGHSVTIPKLTDTVERDEFYDADESFHELTDANTADTITAVALAQAHSEHGNDQKGISEQTQSQRTSATPREPSKTITIRTGEADHPLPMQLPILTTILRFEGPYRKEEKGEKELHQLVEWAPRSPDLTPLVYFLWAYLKDRVYRSNPKNLEELRRRIVQGINAIPRQMIYNATESFYNRIIGYCEEANVEQFEQRL